MMKKQRTFWIFLISVLLLHAAAPIAQSAQAKQAVDPVCGMKVDQATAKETFEYQGTIYYFCSKSCKDKFAADPEAFLNKYQEMAGPKKKCWIGEDTYCVYRFVDPPKLGTAILKIEVFDKDGRRVTDLRIIGRSDMPSMSGAHDSGEVAFKLNKKGDYLLPVNIVMAGEWEVRLHFMKGTDIIYRGSIKFHV
jgi:YHS domain-containing protein